MRLYEILSEEVSSKPPANSLSANLKKQADAKSQQAKKLRQQSAIQKKREKLSRLTADKISTGQALSSLLSNTK